MWYAKVTTDPGRSRLLAGGGGWNKDKSCGEKNLKRKARKRVKIATKTGQNVLKHILPGNKLPRPNTAAHFIVFTAF